MAATAAFNVNEKGYREAALSPHSSSKHPLMHMLTAIAARVDQGKPGAACVALQSWRGRPNRHGLYL